MDTVLRSCCSSLLAVQCCLKNWFLDELIDEEDISLFCDLTLALGNCLVGLDLLFSSETTMKNYILQITLLLLISVLLLSKLMTSSA